MIPTPKECMHARESVIRQAKAEIIEDVVSKLRAGAPAVNRPCSTCSSESILQIAKLFQDAGWRILVHGFSRSWDCVEDVDSVVFGFAVSYPEPK